MRLLLDTHVLLWWLADDPLLTTRGRTAIAESDVAVVSTATAWEISMKRSLGKLAAPDDLAAQLARHHFTVLPIHLDHALRAGSLPNIHRDPFDRMLVAQAQAEDLVVITSDANIPRYDVRVLDAV